MKKRSFIYWVCSALVAISCSSGNAGSEVWQLETDKACYSPSEPVKIKASGQADGQLFVRYRHLNDIVKEEPLPQKEWTWMPPADDYRGYMVEVYENRKDGNHHTLGSIAIDVSSDWKKFPRYGFLSHYSDISEDRIKENIATLNRHHINGVQYQDWHCKHHQPMAGTVEKPEEEWTDIANRKVQKNVVHHYIAETHKYGMKSIFYNLCFGVLKDAEQDGVRADWFLYKDNNKKERDKHPLPSHWKSDIYLVNPGNADWQRYLAGENEKVYHTFDFDGYQIDQLGSRGKVYDAQGQEVDLPSGYLSFIGAMKQAHLGKSLVMNAVSEFGQEQIAKGEVDFFYNEVWGENAAYTDLVRILENNRRWNDTLSTVFAAYMNYNVADSSGYFNTPGVLLTDAVMFAFGASHLELGEHMLGKEYFPNDNLKMKAELKAALVSYYDFLVGYQNLLRDGGTFNKVELSCTDGKMKLASWPPRRQHVAVVGKQKENCQLIHLINLSEAVHLDWRDADGNQPEPKWVKEAALTLHTSTPVKKLWMASPDINGGLPLAIEFKQNTSGISFVLPGLKYWDMIVVEFK